MSPQPTSAPLSQQYLDAYKGETLLAVCALFIIFETIFVGLRYYARYLTTADFGWDDAIIPAAWLTNIGLCVLCITAVFDAGVGRHLAAVLKYDPSKFIAWSKSLYALDWLYLTSVALPKMSILCLYLRIFTDRKARLACHALLWITGGIWLTFTIAFNLQCIPLAYQWDKTLPGGHCFNVGAYYKATSAPNIVTDVIILVLPIPTVIKLQTTGIRKLGLSFVFMVGSIGLIGSCVRMATFFRYEAFTDNTWASVPLMSWSVVEPGMYLIAACLLTLRPILRKFSPKEFGSKLRNTVLFRKSHDSKNDDSQRFRHEGQAPGNSGAGFIELQSIIDRHSADREPHLPLKSAVPLPMQHDFDLEHGPVYHVHTEISAQPPRS